MEQFSKNGFRAVPILKIGEQFINGFSINEFNKFYLAKK